MSRLDIDLNAQGQMPPTVCMFDPLDLYTPSEDPPANKEDDVTDKILPDNGRSIQDSQVLDDEDLPVDILDLPSVRYASAEVVLCALLLLKPGVQVNFQDLTTNELSVTEMCRKKGISRDKMNSTVSYYQVWGNTKLDTAEKICRKIPLLVSRREMLLNYYTSVLKHYDRSQNSSKDLIIKEVSMRISESCGRTAQPAMKRQFKFENLERCIEIYEPSLTADNLGWKTWGSSFILSQKLINYVAQLKISRKLRVLELGSGTGLAGIAWLAKWMEVHDKLGVEMFLTDLEEIIPNLQKNVEINGLAPNSIVNTLDWTSPDAFLEQYSGKRFDYILVSDPIYSPDHPKFVVDVIARFLSPQGTCHLEIPLRNKYAQERNCLWEFLDNHGLKVVEQVEDEGVDDWGQVTYMYQKIVWRRYGKNN
ncbi:related to Putative methyltransferase [Zygosaccharomyces bailii ISA1307]|nr:related to Putative methyltransferase [Zygosaccharomyces bailii ISA1307]